MAMENFISFQHGRLAALIEFEMCSVVMKIVPDIFWKDKSVILSLGFSICHQPSKNIFYIERLGERLTRFIDYREANLLDENDIDMVIKNSQRFFK